MTKGKKGVVGSAGEGESARLVSGAKASMAAAPGPTLPTPSRGTGGNGDDIRAIINKYLPPSVQLRERRDVSRPKVRAPLPPARTVARPDASACIRAHPEDQPSRSEPPVPSPLSPRQLAAARALAAGKRVGDVAAALPVNRTTLLRWRKLPEFDEELRRIHWQMSQREY